MVIAVFGNIRFVGACELRIDQATGVQTLFGADCNPAVPPGTIGRPNIYYGNQYGNQYVGQPYGGGNAINVGSTGMSSAQIGGAVAGGLLGSTGKSNTAVSTVGGALAGWLLGTFYDRSVASNQQNQQVVLRPVEQQQSSQPARSNAKCDGDKIVGHLKWSGHPQDGQEVCLQKNDPHYSP